MKRNVKLRLHIPTGHAPSNTPHKAPPLTTPTARSLPIGTAVWSSGEGALYLSCLLAGLPRSLRVCLQVSICVSVSCDLSLCASHLSCVCLFPNLVLLFLSALPSLSEVPCPIFLFTPGSYLPLLSFSGSPDLQFLSFAERTRTLSLRCFCSRSSSDCGSRAPPCGHHGGLDGGEGERPSKQCCGVARDIQRWCDPRKCEGASQRWWTPGDDV